MEWYNLHSHFLRLCTSTFFYLFIYFVLARVLQQFPASPPRSQTKSNSFQGSSPRPFLVLSPPFYLFCLIFLSSVFFFAFFRIRTSYCNSFLRGVEEEEMGDEEGGKEIWKRTRFILSFFSSMKKNEKKNQIKIIIKKRNRRRKRK